MYVLLVMTVKNGLKALSGSVPSGNGWSLSPESMDKRTSEAGNVTGVAGRGGTVGMKLGGEGEEQEWECCRLPHHPLSLLRLESVIYTHHRQGHINPWQSP